MIAGGITPHLLWMDRPILRILESVWMSSIAPPQPEEPHRPGIQSSINFTPLKALAPELVNQLKERHHSRLNLARLGDWQVF